MTVLPFPIPMLRLDQVVVREMTAIEDGSTYYRVEGCRRGEMVADFGLFQGFDTACCRARFHARDHRLDGYGIGGPPRGAA